MAYIVMAYVVMAYVFMAYIVMAYVIMAYIVMAYVVMAYIVMAYIVMACHLRVVLVSFRVSRTGMCTSLHESERQKNPTQWKPRRHQTYQSYKCNQCRGTILDGNVVRCNSAVPSMEHHMSTYMSTYT